MSDPKIYFGKTIDITQSNHDVFVFVPDGFKGNKDELISNARLKFIELSEREQFRESNQRSGIKTQPQIVNRPKRKRIGQ